MAEIAVTIRGRSYPIVCEDGQEDHIAQLAEYLDQRAQELLEQVGQVSSPQLMVMVGLLVADELSDAFERINGLESDAEARAAKVREDVLRGYNEELGKLRVEMAEAETRARRAGVDDVEATLAPRLIAMAERLESIAARLQAD